MGGKFCWQWFVPDCEPVKCPEKPYCPPPAKCKFGEGKCPPHTCPQAGACPKQPPCAKPYWKDMCSIEQAEKWITSGDFSGMTAENSEFLRKAKPPPPSEEKYEAKFA